MIVVVDCFSCAPAAQMLQSNGDLKRKWTWAVEWLQDELERVRITIFICIVNTFTRCDSADSLVSFVPKSYLVILPSTSSFYNYRMS